MHPPISISVKVRTDIACGTQPEYEADLVLGNDDVMLVTFSGWNLATRHLRFQLVPINVEMLRHDAALAYLSNKARGS